jgi:YfiH family protein
VSSRAAGRPILETRVGNARVWCTGRSQGNLGDHVGDDPGTVARNRAEVRAAVGAEDSARWTWLRQVHGADVYVVTGSSAGAEIAPPVADAAVTNVPGRPLAVVTADCAPLVVASDDAVGVVHAGHRGLAAGVIEATIASVRSRGHGPIRAFLGPCIRPPNYEFGADDLARFVAQFGPEVEGRTRDGKPALDIPAAIRIVLTREGVVEFEDSSVCTADSDDYFSYRRAHETGRQATIAVLQCQ